jgi:hypothetical protein
VGKMGRVQDTKAVPPRGLDGDMAGAILAIVVGWAGVKGRVLPEDPAGHARFIDDELRRLKGVKTARTLEMSMALAEHDARNGTNLQKLNAPEEREPRRPKQLERVLDPALVERLLPVADKWARRFNRSGATLLAAADKRAHDLARMPGFPRKCLCGAHTWLLLAWSVRAEEDITGAVVPIRHVCAACLPNFSLKNGEFLSACVDG